MELRLVTLVLRLLDPRRWRARLLQLAAGAGVLGWIWMRAVLVADERVAVRDARRVERAARISARVRRLERGA